MSGAIRDTSDPGLVWAHRAGTLAMKARFGHAVTPVDIDGLLDLVAPVIDDDPTGSAASAVRAIMRFSRRLREDADPRPAGQAFLQALHDWRGGIYRAELAKIEAKLEEFLAGSGEAGA